MRSQRDSLCVLSVTGFKSRISLKFINHVLHPRQGNRDADATISNSSSKRDLQQHGGDEATTEHAHFQLAKHDLHGCPFARLAGALLGVGARGTSMAVGVDFGCAVSEVVVRT